jgi:phage anti-repressor protein
MNAKTDLKVIENGLVPIYEDKQARRVINAREMHEFLGSERQFANWIQYRIDQYGFEEGNDYFCLTNLLSKKGRGGHNAIEYLLTIDVAKELAMVENNEKGREVRRYFIACENALKESAVISPAEREQLNAQVRRADAMLANAKARLSKELRITLDQYKDRLSGVSIDAYLGEILYLATGSRLLPPMIEKSYSTGDLAEEYGVSPNRIGRIATKYDIRTEQYGFWVLDTAPGGNQVQNFRYDERRRQKIKECLMADGYFSSDGSASDVIDIDDLAGNEC